MRHYRLRNICECTPAQQQQILDIRNSDAVRFAMYTDHVIPLTEHMAYIARLRTDDGQRVFLLLDADDRTVGMASVSRIDQQHRKCDWAFYLDATARGGVGSAIEVFMLDYVFQKLGMEKLNCEVIETNPAVVAMHRKFGFSEEGFRRANIEKDGQRIGVYFLGMTASEWQAERPAVMERLGSRLDDISITLEP